VTRVFESRAALEAGVLELALRIATKSPLGIRGTKQALNYARDHSVADGLQQIASWNAGMLLSDDLMAIMLKGRKDAAPQFRD
jgi:enoyl-CoA hydratase